MQHPRRDVRGGARVGRQGYAFSGQLRYTEPLGRLRPPSRTDRSRREQGHRGDVHIARGGKVRARFGQGDDGRQAAGADGPAGDGG